ncbi:MAG TPA: hypothetical protein VG476_04550 [Acidimicrobiales bacterium]|nr:hypothetical protein [Acidimicrobiales bacterium]
MLTTGGVQAGWGRSDALRALEALDDQRDREWAERARGLIECGLPMPRRDTGPAIAAQQVRLAAAFVEASVAYAYGADWWARVESEWLRIEEEIFRREHALDRVVDRYLPANLDPKLRDLFRLPAHQAQAAILGERDEQGHYHAGLASLTEPEFTALELALDPIIDEVVVHRTSRRAWGDEVDMHIIQLRPRETWEIARDMVGVRQRRQFGRRAWLQVDTVERYLRAAKAKLRHLFWAADPEMEAPEDDENPL